MRKLVSVTLLISLAVLIGFPVSLASMAGGQAKLAPDQWQSESTLSFSNLKPKMSNDPVNAHWPEWRGPYRNGMASGDAPTTWSDTKNIKWKTEIPGRGFSTPVIWRDKVFLTTAVPTGKTPEASPTSPRQTPTDSTQQPASSAPSQAPAAAAPRPEGQASNTSASSTQSSGRGGRQGGPGGGAGALVEHKLLLICLDRKTGKVIWQKTARVSTPHEGYHRTYGSFASNSPITDGKHLYASFGSRGIYCYDLNGKLIWEKDLGVQMRMRLQFGEGAAPALDDDRIFLTFDHEAGSFLVALDKRTGKELWRAARDEPSSWSTPLVIEHAGRRQVIVSATRKVRGYDVKTGKVIWECAGLGSNVISAPVYQDGIVLVMSGHRDPKLMAIKLGSEGDLTGTDAVLWSHTRGTSYTLSPVLHDGKLYVVTDSGQVSSFNVTTGEPYYHQMRLPKPYNFKASPVGANNKLYLASEEGDVLVLKLGEKFDVVATNTLEDQTFISSPVIANGELFLRSKGWVYCISGS